MKAHRVSWREQVRPGYRDCYRGNGSEQLITNGETGFFVPHENPQAIADAMLRLMAEPLLCRRLGVRLRSKVEQEYGPVSLVRRWEALFYEVLAAVRSPWLNDVAHILWRSHPTICSAFLNILQSR